MSTMTIMTRELPPIDEMRRAFATKDRAYDGTFVVAVRTTSIFCRPVCRARPPRAENVEFFATPDEALRHGYRPCKLCKPLETVGATPTLVSRLMELVADASDGRVTSEELKSLGIDPSTARRQFRAHCGTSFAAYQRTNRLGVAARELREGRSAGYAGAAAGFQSDSGFRAAIERTFDLPATSFAGTEVLTSRWIATPLGSMLAIAHDRGIVLLDFADRATLEPSLAKLRARIAARKPLSDWKPAAAPA
jgi:AraC family transcriptional regulator, regulatory protein of adaptative response / methylated-DNA-[protein]-cysteine methyltransferase